MDLEFGSIREDNYAEVVDIYLEGIATGMATFETQAPSWKEWEEKHLPFGNIALKEEGKIQGWAALSAVSSRCVYAGVAEVSVYVAAAARGKGVGRKLLNKLIDISEENNIWTLQAGIFRNNEASINLHKSCGFRVIGYKEKIGKLGNEWLDNMLLEKRSTKVGI